MGDNISVVASVLCIPLLFLEVPLHALLCLSMPLSNLSTGTLRL